MADTSTLSLPQSKKEVKNPTSVLGGPIGWLDETMELAVRGQGVFVNERPVSSQDLEQLAQMPKLESGGFPLSGSIEFNKPSDAQLIEEQRVAILGRNQIRSHEEFVQEEEIRFEVAGMSEEEGNRRLHLNLSLRKEHTTNLHHRVELYRQKKAELRSFEQQEKDAQIPSPAKRDPSRDATFEGRSISAGGVSMNLSAQSGGTG